MRNKNKRETAGGGKVTCSPNSLNFSNFVEELGKTTARTVFFFIKREEETVGADKTKQNKTKTKRQLF